MQALNLQLASWATVLVLEFTILDTGIHTTTAGKNIRSMSTLKLTTSQWRRIRAELHTEHPKTVFMIRDKMKRVLGFTVREHTGYRLRTPKELVEYDMSDDIRYETEKERKFFKEHIHEHLICLDFYSEKKYTMFLLKFSELLHKGNQNDII
jgi:hypothetical protein